MNPSPLEQRLGPLAFATAKDYFVFKYWNWLYYFKTCSDRNVRIACPAERWLKRQ